MLARKRSIAELTFVLFALAACDGATTPESKITEEERAAVMSLVSASGSSWQTISRTDTRDGNRSVGSRVFACPGGGERRTDFTSISEKVSNPDGQILSTTQKMQFSNCILTSSTGQAIRSVDGTLDLTTFARFKNTGDPVPGVQNGYRSERLLHRFTHKGKLTFIGVDGVKKECEMDMERVYDYPARTMTAKGLSCGQRVEYTTPLGPKD